MICWGANSHGQLGLGYQSEMCETPQLVEALPVDVQQIRLISAGAGHSLICTDSGDLYSSGWNNRGQLGLGHTEDVCRYTHAGSYNFIQLACGWDVSAGLTAEGDLCLWGSNVWQQVGEKDVNFLTTPTKLELPTKRKATKVCFGLRHTCVLTEDGGILVFGKSKWLQKEGLKSIIHQGVEFYDLMLSEKIEDVASGENHLVFRLKRNTIVCRGDNKFGQSPSGVDLNPQKLAISSLQSGWSHSGYLTDDGRVYLWGRNNNGQLGVAADGCHNEPVLLDIESKVIDFCLGSQHGIALAADGLYTWGWNEHGNCGTGGVENVLTPTKMKGMKQVDRIVAGAGFCCVLRKTV